MVLKDSIYWRIFGEIWSYFKRHMEADQIDWQKAVDEARALGRTYENTPQFPLVKALIFAAQGEMERLDVRKTDIKEQSDNKTACANTLTSKKGSEFYGKE